MTDDFSRQNEFHFLQTVHGESFESLMLLSACPIPVLDAVCYPCLYPGSAGAGFEPGSIDRPVIQADDRRRRRAMEHQHWNCSDLLMKHGSSQTFRRDYQFSRVAGSHYLIIESAYNGIQSCVYVVTELIYVCFYTQMLGAMRSFSCKL